MKFYILFSIMCMIALAAADDDKAKTEKEGHKPYERPVSDKEHHEDDDELHDPAFDHEAFLGKEDSEKFDSLSPEESVKRLGELVDKVDKNGDGKITQEELQQWIHELGQKSIREDSKRQFEALWPKDGKVTFDTYATQTHGKPEKKDMDEHFKESLERDKRKWKLADQDGDGSLSLEEFTSFIHPEEAPHMREVVIAEAMADMDKDKNGFISLDEYLHDHWQPTESDKKEPEWLQSEREAFTKSRDKNHDNQLDGEEVGDWLMPKDYDHSLSEAQHLISKSDENNDGVLTKDEILKNHELFAGSQATDYGNALGRHEEL